ncbi:hypothetical protein V2W45_1205930, partial [Cenococcum geophilum]
EDEDGLSDSDVDRSHGGEYSREDDESASTKGHSRWLASDDERLLAYRGGEYLRPWRWIFRQFPHRTEGAVRTRYHLLQGK